MFNISNRSLDGASGTSRAAGLNAPSGGINIAPSGSSSGGGSNWNGVLQAGNLIAQLLAAAYSVKQQNDAIKGVERDNASERAAAILGGYRPRTQATPQVDYISPLLGAGQAAANYGSYLQQRSDTADEQTRRNAEENSLSEFRKQQIEAEKSKIIADWFLGRQKIGAQRTKDRQTLKNQGRVATAAERRANAAEADSEARRKAIAEKTEQDKRLSDLQVGKHMREIAALDRAAEEARLKGLGAGLQPLEDILTGVDGQVLK